MMVISPVPAPLIFSHGSGGAPPCPLPRSASLRFSGFGIHPSSLMSVVIWACDAGKLRPAAVGKKEKLQGEGRGCREPSRLAALAAPRHRHGDRFPPSSLQLSVICVLCLMSVVNIRYLFSRRTNRAFGTTRSTNVNLQKLPAVDSKSLKQPKPVVISRRLPQKDASKIELKTESTGGSRDQAKDATSKPKPEAKKSVVRFQDQERPAEKNIRKSPTPEEGPLTPKSSIRPALLGTPYFSAQSCSKCRFDKLEYAPYWLTQIKLAESVGKHFASAAFFRLAFECNAEVCSSPISFPRIYFINFLVSPNFFNLAPIF